jgi:molybdate transport system permease protein
MQWQPLILSLELALISTVLLFLISLPLSYWLAKSRSILKPLFESLISLPLVLPPTVLGFYFLVFLGQNGTLGSWFYENFNVSLVFSFEGLVLGSMIYSLPFMVHPIAAGIANFSNPLQEASYVLGKSKFTTLFKIILPNIKPAVVSAIILSFAHTLGEFGLVLMIGGNMPGKTKVASIAIFEAVESLNYAEASNYSLVLLLVSLFILVIVFALNNKRREV